MSRKLVLFDVDGVLVRTDIISYDYWHEVMKKHFGLNISRDDIYMEGKTDSEIMKEFLESYGMKKSFSNRSFREALNDIAIIYKKAMKARKLIVVKIPYVESFLERLLEEKHVIGLLTGNTREKARIKLQDCGLWKYFKVGAFGDDSDKRSKLVSIAMNDAKDKNGVDFSKEDVFIVGDTVRDIQCARDAGVKSIAVATGIESFEMLKRENPDFIFENFNDIDRIIGVFNEK